MSETNSRRRASIEMEQYLSYLSRFLYFVDETDLRFEVFFVAVALLLLCCLIVGVSQVDSLVLAIAVLVLLIVEGYRYRRFDWLGAWEEVESLTRVRQSVVV